MEAARWFHAAAEQGEPNAETNLGIMNATGQGESQDLAEAVRWFRMAAEQGQPRSEDVLGRAYATGLGVEKNDAEALQWYLKSAALGLADAQLRAGISYRRGTGTGVNYTESLRWLRKAFDQGNLLAKEWLGDAYRIGLGVPVDLGKATDLYWIAAEGGSASAMNKCRYGLLIREPDVAPNLVESLKWLILAIQRSEPGDVHDRAIVNFRQAQAKATPEQFEEARQRASEPRTKWSDKQ